MIRRGTLLLTLAAVVVLGGITVAPGADASVARPGDTTGRRRLILSVPGLTWSEVAAARLPAFERILEDSAMADLAPRGVFARSGPGDAYLTISAGARATTSRSVDGQVLALDEDSGGASASEVFTRRTGADPSGSFVSLTWPSLVRKNAARPYDAELGLLAATLADAGIRTSVIGNAGGTDDTQPSYERQVALATAAPDGSIDRGAITDDLLVGDGTRPFGVRFNHSVVVQRFEEEWSHVASSDAGGVVLLEASDLARVMRYRGVVARSRYETMRAEALRDTDRLLMDVLDSVDLTQDSVLLVAPYNLPGHRDLTVAALRTPAGVPGYLGSASTQRTGYLTLVDVGPTILDRFGLERPSAMEGRAAEVVRSSASLDERIDHLSTLNAASRFRERLLTPTTMVVVLLLALATAAGALAVIRARGERWRRTVALLALIDLAILPASFLARGLPLEDLGAGVYWAVVVGFSILAAVLATVLARHRDQPALALKITLGLVALVLVGDVTTGSRLSLNAAFGYSPTGNSRLYGISNYSYGQLAAAVCLLGGFVAASGRSRARLASLMLLGGTLVVLGVPIWGADVGGVLAFTPTILLFGMLVYGQRVRIRTLVIGGIAAALATTLFGLLDLARSPTQRGHLGRLFERIGADGLGPLLSIVQRKLVANLSVSTSSLWVAALPIGIALWVLIANHPSRPLGALRDRIPTLGAGLAAAIVAAVLGSMLNDSGAIVGGVSAMVLTASVVHLLMVHEAPPGPRYRDLP